MNRPTVLSIPPASPTDSLFTPSPSNSTTSSGLSFELSGDANSTLPSSPASIKGCTFETLIKPFYQTHHEGADPWLSEESTCTASSESLHQQTLPALTQGLASQSSSSLTLSNNAALAGEAREAFAAHRSPREMQPADLGYSNPATQGKQEAYYDPSSADGYGDPSNNAFFSNNGGAGLSAPQGAASHETSSLDRAGQFRETDVGASPFSSPHVGPVSPGFQHRRSSSFGSDAVSPPPFSLPDAGYDQGLVQPLGQLGQISLNDNSQYPLVFDQDALETSSVTSFYSQGRNPGFAPTQSPYSDHLSISGASHKGNYLVSHSPLIEKSQSSAPQLSLGIPVVSVSDTTMNYSSDVTGEAMPSIQVMAPSPSTPKAGGRYGQQTSFQDILAQLQAQNASQGIDAISEQHEQSHSGWTMSSDAYATQAHTGTSDDTGFGQLSGAGTTSTPAFHSDGAGKDASWLSPQPSGSILRLHSASARVDPDGYHAEPAETFVDLSGDPAKPAYSQGQWSSQAKRQDSYDKIRQFLRLDVDMGFPGTPKVDPPTTPNPNSFRKRANSDVGPRSPIAGLGGAPDWLQLGVLENEKMSGQDGSSADWGSFEKKMEIQGLYPGSQTGLPMQTTVMAMQTANSEHARTMDPSLINSSINQAQHDLYSSNNLGQNPASGSTQQNYGSFGGMQGGHSEASQQPRLNTEWRFPLQGQSAVGGGNSDGLQPTPKNLRRSQSARHNGGGHRRAARSEDLSRFGTRNMPHEDFLSRITAPDGGLAPPSTGRAVPNNSGVASTSFYSSSPTPRAHPYRTSHDRHHSLSSNASNSSVGSAAGSISPHLLGGFSPNAAAGAGQYSCTTLPTYGNLGTSGSASVSSSVGSPGGGSMLSIPPVPVVTSQATQAASASRRKGEALFSCPVPGCGSTFTRQYNLRGHLRSHADERPFKCEWPGCDKSFARAHDCKRHQNLHLNIKPHTCNHCGKTFARLDALNRHQKSDTGGCTMRQSESGSQTGDDSNASASDLRAGAQSGDGGSCSKKGFGGHVL